MSVASLSAHTSIERAHEVANECRKLNKALKECQELAQTYNNRERLLGLPVTNVSAVRIKNRNNNFVVILV
jgi:dynein heavy chain